MPELPQRRRRPARLAAAAALLAAALGAVAPWRSPLGEPALLSPLAAAAAAGAGGAAEAAPPACEDVYEEHVDKVAPRIARWEKAATESQIIGRFGNQASRLLNRTLADFDRSVRKRMGEGAGCPAERQALERSMREQLESVFLVQRSTIEEALYQRLKADLLRQMRRRKRELDVKEKLKLMHASLREYDLQVRDLLPFFVQNSERDRAERRLSELQRGIAEVPEAQEMQRRWRMNQMMRTPARQSQGFSWPTVSLSVGLRLMARPGGLGNFHLSSRRQVGPPHNPSEISVGVLNDGDVMDVYNKQPKPPLLKLQPTVSMDVSAG